jgi:DNA-directed RNA polymerase subunit alpha
MLETSLLSKGITPHSPEAIFPEIKVLETGDRYGKFAIEPLERGYGITIGNPIRRILLSSVDGAAVTWVKIDGVLHEYSTIPNVKEGVMEFLVNVKGIRIRSRAGRPGKMRLDIRGEGRVCAGDIATSADFEVVNPEFHLATLNSDDATLVVEFNVEPGKGYQPVPQGDAMLGPMVGVLPVDAIFSPVRKVNYAVERTRVGQVTDYERLVLEVWTDGTITPAEAIRASSDILVKHFFAFANVGKEREAGPERPAGTVSPEVYQTPIEKLQLSPRTLNCLKRAHITRVGQVLEMTNEELLKIRNFGEKSLGELLGKLQEDGMLLGQSDADDEPGGVEGLEVSGSLGSEDDSLATDEDEAFWDNMGDEEDQPVVRPARARKRPPSEDDNNDDDDDE